MIEELEIGESDETLQDIIGQIEKFKAELNFSLELGAAATDQSAVVIRVPVPLEQDRPSFEGSSPPQSYEAERHLQIEPNPSLDSSASRGGIDSHGAGSATDLPAGASGPDSYGGGSSASTSLLGSAADLTAIGSAHGEIYRSDDAHDALGYSTLLASQIDMPPTSSSGFPATAPHPPQPAVVMHSSSVIESHSGLPPQSVAVPQGPSAPVQQLPDVAQTPSDASKAMSSAMASAPPPHLGPSAPPPADWPGVTGPPYAQPPAVASGVTPMADVAAAQWHQQDAMQAAPQQIFPQNNYQSATSQAMRATDISDDDEVHPRGAHLRSPLPSRPLLLPTPFP